MRRDARGVLFVVIAGALLLVVIVFLRPPSASVTSPPAPSIGVLFHQCAPWRASDSRVQYVRLT
jgi:hypothetical protein